MQTINANTKRGAALVAAYNRSSKYSLRDCYGRYSNAKAAAENDCRRWCSQENGYGFKIISYNSVRFTAAWRTADGLRVETPCNSFIVK